MVLTCHVSYCSTRYWSLDSHLKPTCIADWHLSLTIFESTFWSLIHRILFKWYTNAFSSLKVHFDMAVRCSSRCCGDAWWCHAAAFCLQGMFVLLYLSNLLCMCTHYWPANTNNVQGFVQKFDRYDCAICAGDVGFAWFLQLFRYHLILLS